MPTRRRGDDWSKDQVILAMDLYKTLGRAPNGEEPEVLELSRLIGRKPTAVTFKVGNLKSIETHGEHGFKHTGAVDKEVWDRFSSDLPGLRRRAVAIRGRLGSAIHVGWIFKADATLGWHAKTKARRGKKEYWERVPSSNVREWSPFLIMQCGVAKPGFYGRGTILPSKGDPRAYVRYDEVFAEPFLFEDASPSSVSGRGWDDGRIPFLLGLRSPQGHKAAPCRMTGSHFPLSESDAKRLGAMFPGLRWLHSESTEEEKAASEVVRVGRGQGFFMGSSAKRKKIEELAMARARNHFESRGYKVQDFHSKRPFDLKCERDGESLFVEVKGTTTHGERVLVTRGEVRFARKNAPNVVLFVVSSLDASAKDAKKTGAVRLIRPWTADERRLTATGYFYETA